jgi:hypothetical protein
VTQEATWLVGSLICKGSTHELVAAFEERSIIIEKLVSSVCSNTKYNKSVLVSKEGVLLSPFDERDCAWLSIDSSNNSELVCASIGLQVGLVFGVDSNRFPWVVGRDKE